MTRFPGEPQWPSTPEPPPVIGVAPVFHSYPASPPIERPPVTWRSRKLLITMNHTVLPGRCVRCNAPVGDRRMKRRYWWHHPALYLTVLAGLLIYAIIAICVRQQATVHLGLCDRHRRRRRIHIAVSWLLILGAIAAFIGAVAINRGETALLAAALFFGGLIYAAITTPLLVPRRIEGGYIWLKGCSKEYLAEFPELPARA